MRCSIAVLLGVCFTLVSTKPSQRDESAVPVYSDEFARNPMLALAASTFIDNPQPCVTRAMDGTMKRQLSVKCDEFSEDTCSGYAAVSDSTKVIALAFRGSRGSLQVAMEVEDAIFDKKVPLAGGHVDKYFFDALMKLWNAGMKDDFLTSYNKHKDYEIWITGHSLGAAMAAIASSFLVSNYGVDGNKIKLVTFGEPRAGDKAFALQHDATIPYSFRVIHRLDVVPHLPLKDMSFYHHKSEVWYNNDMTKPDYVVCGDDDHKCSDGALTIVFSDHDTYFNRVLGPWASKGCPFDA